MLSDLLLSVFDGQFEPIEVHAVTVLVHRAGGIMVEQNLQFSWRSGMVQKCSGKFLALCAKLLKRMKKEKRDES